MLLRPLSWLSQGSLLLHGAGCWNPVFPARWDDIMVLAARMLRIIDAAVDTGACDTSLRVVDQSA